LSFHVLGRASATNGDSSSNKGPPDAGLCLASVSRLGDESLAIPLSVESVSSANGDRVGLGSGSGWLPLFALVRWRY